METNQSPVEKAVALIGGTNATARALGIKPPSVSRWLRNQRVPAEWCLALEALTKGQVTRYELRPDIFGPKPTRGRPKRK
jgi:DNA-binding transcriptional regulator YdaS (Cro superfamily)